MYRIRFPFYFYYPISVNICSKSMRWSVYSALWAENTSIAKTINIQRGVFLNKKAVKLHYFTSLNFCPEMTGNSALARQ